MSQRLSYAPYITFTIEEWARLRADEPMTLEAADIESLRTLNDPISLAEAEIVYLPLTRLLSFYVEAIQNLHAVSSRFLGHNGKKVPFIIGVAGSVAVGKSTTARILRALLRRWPSSPRVDLVTTDGFLYPNKVLDARGLMERKGSPKAMTGPRSSISSPRSSRDSPGSPPRSIRIWSMTWCRTKRWWWKAPTFWSSRGSISSSRAICPAPEHPSFLPPTSSIFPSISMQTRRCSKTGMSSVS